MAIYLHFAPAVALAVAIGPGRMGWRLTLAGSACAVLPDLDFLLVALHFDSYGGTYGHRGFTHSLAFALLVGAIGALLAGRHPPRSRWFTAGYLALCTASHPLIDGLMDRGICNAWLWPLDGARHCLAWRPMQIPGASLWSVQQIGQDLLWIGVPLLLLANAGMLWRWAWRTRTRTSASTSASASASASAAAVVVPRRGSGSAQAVDAWGEPLPTHTPRAQRQRRMAELRTLLIQWREQYRSRRQRAQRAGAG